MAMNFSRLEILSEWIKLEKDYTRMLLTHKDYFNFPELNRQMFLTSLFCKKQQEMILAMREVEQINNLLPALTSFSDIEKMTMRRIELSDLLSSSITPPEYFPYSLEEIISYVDRIELHQKLLNIPF
jgi:hypothetical protein